MLDGVDPVHPSEALAASALREGWLWEEDFLQIAEHLPSSTRNFQQPIQGDAWSCSFITGAFIHGASAGVMCNTRQFPMVTSLVTSVLNSVAPGMWFSSAGISLNMRSGVHRGSNNDANIPNILVPASDFEHGELWIEDGTGDQLVSGYSGRLIPVSRPYISFNPRVRHATNAWVGTRLIIVGYHVRNSELMSASDRQELCRMGLQVRATR